MQLLFQMSVRVLLSSVSIVRVLLLSFSFSHTGDVFRNIFAHSTTTLSSSISLEGSIPFPFYIILFPAHCCKTILNICFFCQMIFFLIIFLINKVCIVVDLRQQIGSTVIYFFCLQQVAIPKDDFRQPFWTFCFCLLLLVAQSC